MVRRKSPGLKPDFWQALNAGLKPGAPTKSKAPAPRQNQGPGAPTKTKGPALPQDQEPGARDYLGVAAGSVALAVGWNSFMALRAVL